MRFKDELREVPKKSGCYLMYNKDNIVIYVGKAKILFNRLPDYFFLLPAWPLNARVAANSPNLCPTMFSVT